MSSFKAEDLRKAPSKRLKNLRGRHVEVEIVCSMTPWSLLAVALGLCLAEERRVSAPRHRIDPSEF